MTPAITKPFAGTLSPPPHPGDWPRELLAELNPFVVSDLVGVQGLQPGKHRFTQNLSGRLLTLYTWVPTPTASLPDALISSKLGGPPSLLTPRTLGGSQHWAVKWWNRG